MKECSECGRVIPEDFTEDELRDLNVRLKRIPEIESLLKPFCNRARFDREAMGAIELAFCRGAQQSQESAPAENDDGR